MWQVINKIQLRNSVRQLRCSVNVAHSSTHSEKSEEHINIPLRIPRSPIDILNALSSTVGTDPTAPHYKYHDDPFLIPTSNVTKRTYAMAQESGRKAARWIRQQHANLFQHSEAQPPIKAFAPQMVFTEESEVNDTCLEQLINNSEVSDAIFVFKLMKSKSIPISRELRQSVLELLCFYNHEDTLEEDFVEERWFRQGVSGKERQRKTWKDGELAEEIFKELEPQDSQTYAALIRGMCKYFQVERAWALFQESCEKQIDLDTKTFNSLLSVVNFLKESGEMRWELVQNLLVQIKERKLMPDLGTLNSALASISAIGNNRLARSSAQKVLNEFINLGIEPSLATWYYVLIIFCRERGPVSYVLSDILNRIEGKEFKILDLKDTYFFVTAMDVCRNHLHNLSLAKRLHHLLHTGNNYDLIGDSYKESIYYRHYFILSCQTEPLERFMETYELLVPNVYIPEPGVMEEILKAVDASGVLELIPKMWSDMVIFDHISRESLLSRILKIMSENKPSADIPAQQDLDQKFAIIASDIFNKINEQDEDRVRKLNFTGQMLGEIILILSRSGNFEKSLEVFEKIVKEQHKIAGIPSSEAMSAFVDLCIAEKSPSQAINCLQYCSENGLEAKELAQKIKEGFTLSEVHTSKIKSLVGSEN